MVARHKSRTAARNDARSTERRRLDVFAGIAHDLRSPLATITTSAELLEDALDSGTSGYLIAMIQRQVQRMQLMIQDISEYAGFEGGVVVLHPNTIDLAELLKETCTEVQMLDGRHNLTYEIPAAPVRLKGDSNKIRRALENLLINAFKYSPPDTTVRARLRHDEANFSALFEVEDEGPGVPIEARDRDLRTIRETGKHGAAGPRARAPCREVDSRSPRR